jgi:hypothetical protein
LPFYSCLQIALAISRTSAKWLFLEISMHSNQWLKLKTVRNEQR